MKKIILSILIFLTFNFAAFALEKSEVFFLKNNSKVILTKTKGEQLTTIFAFFKTGPLYEKSLEAGISNLTLKMLLRGTKNKNYEEIVSPIESTGGSIIAETEENLGFIKIIIQKKYFSKACAILSEILTSPAFSESELEKVKNEVISEIKKIEDDPEDLVFQTFYENFYKNTPYAWPVAGTIETISKIDRQQIINFYNKTINASNLILSIAGDFEKETLENELNEKFGNFKTSGKSLPFTFPKNFKWLEPIKIIKKKNLKSRWVLVGYPAPQADKKTFPTFKIISTILGGGMNSRLFIRFREEIPIAYAVGASYPLLMGRSHLVAFVQTSSANYSEIANKIKNEVENLKNFEINEEEIKRAKNYFSSFYLAGFEKSSSLAYFKGKLETLGIGANYSEVFLEEIAKLKPEDIKKACKFYLGSPLTLVVEGS